MSIAISSRYELLTVARTLVKYQIVDQKSAFELMDAISEAQCMAYKLQYGEGHGSMLGGPDHIKWDDESVEPGIAHDMLGMMCYNTVSASGVECLSPENSREVGSARWRLYSLIPRQVPL